MEIVWRRSAREDLISARRYIAKHNPSAAQRVFFRIIAAVEQLAQRPDLGRPGRVEHTRELVVTDTPYLVAYAVLDRQITMLVVLQDARCWPERLS